MPKIFILFLPFLLITGCTNSSSTLKLYCEGEGESSTTESYKDAVIKHIKEIRTYLISNEEALILTNDKFEHNKLAEIIKISPTIKFNSYFGVESWSDGTNYHYVDKDELNGKSEETFRSVKITENSIYAERSSRIVPVNPKRDEPYQTISNLRIDIDRVSGTFKENYYQSVSSYLNSRIIIEQKTLKGACKKILQNSI
jgi:hypothetical protein